VWLTILMQVAALETRGMSPHDKWVVSREFVKLR